MYSFQLEYPLQDKIKKYTISNMIKVMVSLKNIFLKLVIFGYEN